MEGDENCNRAKLFLGSPNLPLVCMLLNYANAQFYVQITNQCYMFLCVGGTK